MSGRQAHVRLWELYHLAARDNMIAMRIIAIEQDAPGADERGMAGHLREEALAAWRLKQRGVLRDIWFTAADNRAVLMLECRDEAEAQEIIATLPLVRHGFIAFQTMALRAYDGFERLFSEDIRAKILGA